MKYRIAQDEDYADARAMLAAQGLPDQEIGFPTILAFDGEILAGFIATTPRPDMVLGGPMVLGPIPNAPLVAARLATLYQQVLRSIGITQIVFYADENDSPFGRGMKRLFPQIEPYAKIGSVMYYHWPLNPELQRSA